MPLVFSPSSPPLHEPPEIALRGFLPARIDGSSPVSSGFLRCRVVVVVVVLVAACFSREGFGGVWLVRVLGEGLAEPVRFLRSPPEQICGVSVWEHVLLRACVRACQPWIGAHAACVSFGGSVVVGLCERERMIRCNAAVLFVVMGSLTACVLRHSHGRRHRVDSFCVSCCVVKIFMNGARWRLVLDVDVELGGSVILQIAS